MVDVSESVRNGCEPATAGQQFFSAGIHPWTTSVFPSSELLARIENFARRPDVAAIGECGVDLAKGGPLFIQLNAFRWCADLSEKLHKPLIIHDVKAHDILLGLKRDLHPSQPWLIHGFRYKPSVAAMFLRAGFLFSFGENFNPDTLRALPDEVIFAETDCSQKNINEIIASISSVRDRDMTSVIAANCARFLNKTP